MVLLARERLCRNSHSRAEDQPVYFSPTSATSIHTTTRVAGVKLRRAADWLTSGNLSEVANECIFATATEQVREQRFGRLKVNDVANRAGCAASKYHWNSLAPSLSSHCPRVIPDMADSCLGNAGIPSSPNSRRELFTEREYLADQAARTSYVRA